MRDMIAVCCHAAADFHTSEAFKEVKLKQGHHSQNYAVAEPLEGPVAEDLDHLVNAAATPTGEAIDQRHHGKGPVHLEFTRPNGVAVHVCLDSRPLCVRFSKTSPLTVTQVSRDLTASAAIHPGDVLTYVDGIAVPHQARDAGLLLRHALRDLPQRCGTEQINNDDENVEKCARLSTTSTTVSIAENGMTQPLTTAESLVGGFPKCSIDTALLYYHGHLASAGFGL